MNPLMKFIPYPIQWYEGMLLMPQHFQQADQLQNHLLNYNFSLMSPYHWGVVSCAVDPAQLVNGLFRILSLEAILPDGTVVFFPHAPDDVLELDLTSLAKDIQEVPLKIYLALPESHQGESNEEGALPRYDSVENTLVVDQNTGETPLSVACLKPRIQLTAARTPPARYVCLPLAEIEMRTNTFAQTSYLPPQLCIGLQSPLGEVCLHLVRRIRDKISYLQGKIQNIQAESLLDPQALARIEDVRRHLVMGILPFEAVLNTGNAHPYALFLALTQLVAQGAAIRPTYHPPFFEPYQHANVYKSFEQLALFMDDVLNHIEESYVFAPFTQQDRVYSLALRPEWSTDEFVLGLHAQPHMTEDDLIRWARECLIATDEFVHLAQDNRVLGAPREVVLSVPQLNLVPSRGTILVVVKGDPNFIKKGEVLRLFNISDKPTNRPQEIVLYLPNQPHV